MFPNSFFNLDISYSTANYDLHRRIVNIFNLVTREITILELEKSFRSFKIDTLGLKKGFAYEPLLGKIFMYKYLCNTKSYDYA